MFDLEDLGWNAWFESHFEVWRGGGCEPGRVVGEERDLWRVQAAGGELRAAARGKLRHEAEARGALPAVGDWVALQARPAEGRATIHGVLPRRSKLSRRAPGRTTTEQVLASNVDSILLVQSLDRDLSLRRLERGLALVWESGARPVVVLSKQDLCGDPEPLVRDVRAVAAGADVLALSAQAGAGLEALDVYLQRGHTLVLVGASGVGKSTLINRLLGEERQRVQEIRARDDRGRHTTTSRALFVLPRGGMLVDTPGLRTLGLWGTAAGVEQAFDDVTRLAEGCRFRDCRHHLEPGCAVREAVDDGRLDLERLESHHKLQRELGHLARKQDVLLRLDEQRKLKAIHRGMKRMKKHL